MDSGFRLVGAAVIEKAAVTGHWCSRADAFDALTHGQTVTVLLPADDVGRAFVETIDGAAICHGGGWGGVRVEAPGPPSDDDLRRLDYVLRTAGLRRGVGHQLWTCDQGRFHGLIAVDPIRRRRHQRRRGC